MRDHLNAICRSMTAALADAAISALLIALMLTLYDIERSVQLAAGIWIAVYAVQAVVNELMAARGVSLLLYLFVNAALLIPGTHAVVTHTAFIPASTVFPVLLRAAALLSGAHSAFCARKLPGSNFFVRCADALILCAALYLATAFSLGRTLNLTVLGFALGVLLLCMVITSSLRAGGESDSVIRGAGAGGYAVLLGLILLCLLATAGMLSLGSGHVDGIVSLLALLWQAVSRAANLFMNVFAQIILLFAGTSRNMRSDPSGSDVSAAEGMDMLAAGEAPAWLPGLLLGLLGAAVLAGVIAILLALRGMKFSRTQTRKKRRRVIRRSHFLSALLAALRRIYARIAFEVAYRLHRRTPQGLFVLAQRTGRLHRLPRRESESAGAYLRRYHEALAAQGSPSSLDCLADALDLALYGGQRIRLSGDEYRRYVRQLRLLHSRPHVPQHAAPEK